MVLGDAAPLDCWSHPCSLGPFDKGEMRRASPNDIPLLVGLMAEFYAEGGYDLNHARAAGAFAAILADDRLGYVWIIQAEHQDVGHIVLTLKYAMEYGGLVACLDDLYVRPDWRNKGLSPALWLTSGVSAKGLASER